MREQHIISNLAHQVITHCIHHHFTIATAESLTGGLLASSLVSIPGASAVFLGSFITYNLHAKEHILHVNHHLLKQAGAVNKDTAQQMTWGTRSYYQTIAPNKENLICISTTGVAGPDSDGYQPVGLVYIALNDNNPTIIREYHFDGTRQEIREKTVAAALSMLAHIPYSDEKE